MGDGRTWPVANQLSESHTQNSLSSCTAMAALGVMIILFSMVKFMPWSDKYWVILLLGIWGAETVSCEVSGASKLMSVKVGIASPDSGVNSGIKSEGVSKSVGSGNSSGAISMLFGVSVTAAGVVGALGAWALGVVSVCASSRR